MKFFLSTLFVVFFISNISFAQSFGASEIKKAEKIIYYGLDFSKAKMVGSEGFANPDDIKARFFRSWNMVIVNEADKYDLKKAFDKDVIKKDFTVIDERNEMPDADELVTNKSYKLSEEEVKNMIASYGAGEYSEGVGLVFIIETFNKSEVKGTMWVTFFNIATKEVIITKRYTGEPGGFGLRNYWIRTVYNVIQQLEEDYRNWERGK
ncbi:MAG: hypothetical protein R2769_09810 [Saprospiraceae bacterium]